MSEFLTRIKSGLWIILAGTIAEVLNLVVENLASFELSPRTEALVVITATAVVSQITKYLNKRAKK